jgi:TatA/E family protein of Tat protein translocase
MIFAVALIVFGPRRLPEIGKTLGKALNEFKKASEELKNTIEREVRVEETKQALSPLINPATYTVSRAEPVQAPEGDYATPTNPVETTATSAHEATATPSHEATVTPFHETADGTPAHEAPSTPVPTHFE